MEISPNTGKVLVKAADPLAKQDSWNAALLHSQQNKHVQQYFLPPLGHCHDSNTLQYLPEDGCYKQEIIGPTISS